MTKKDYVLIAEAIRQARREASDVDQDAIDIVTANIANALKRDNARFDVQRFETASA